MTDAGAAGVMGNLYAESGLRPNNLQNSYEGKLGMADAEYTAMVDHGTYTNFVHDKAGYGLCQWTYWSRKQALLNYAKAKGASIGDLEMQLSFMMQELNQGYRALVSKLKTTASVREASDAFLLQFERPADQSEARQKQRAGYGQKYFDKYAKKGSGNAMGFTNSSLATVKMISPNRTPNRNHAIDTITIHCFVGQVTARRGCEVFQSSSKEASCNYVVGYDGKIGLCVEEKPFLQETLADMLLSRPEVADLTIGEGQFDVVYHLDFCPNCQKEDAPENLPDRISMEEMCAYGYSWEGMLPLGREMALKLAGGGAGGVSG